MFRVNVYVAVLIVATLSTGMMPLYAASTDFAILLVSAAVWILSCAVMFVWSARLIFGENNVRTNVIHMRPRSEPMRLKKAS